MAWTALGEFSTEQETLGAVRALRGRDLPVDVHSPYPLDELPELLDLPPSRIRWAALAGGVCGAAVGYLVQWWMNACDWPLNVGNRPPHSWPAFVLLAYEGLILVASFSILFALVAAAGLPNLHHGALGAAGFESATGDAFWVSVQAGNAADRDAALSALRAAGASRVQAIGEAAP